MSVVLATVGVAVAASPAAPALAAPVPPVTISHLLAKFYPNPENTGSFDFAQVADEQFEQSFPVLDFNPPAVANVFCQGGTTTNETTRPFTDVVRAPDGTCEDESAVGGHWGEREAGVADLQNFEAIFSGSLTVNQAGDITFNVFSDDGWIMWLGEDGAASRPTHVSGALVNIPPHSDAGSPHVVGAYNELSAPTLRQVTVHFPTKGTYPLEIDYTEAHVGDLSLTLGTTYETPIPSTYDGFPPSDWFGNQPDGGYASEPVNTATGNYTREADDLIFPATVKGLNFIRTYNSMDPRGGPLGLGWTANAFSSLDASDADAVILRDWDGRHVTFHPDQTGGYTQPQQYDGTLVATSAGFEIDHTTGEVERFDASGTLIGRSFPDGQHVTYSYSSNGLLSKASSSTGYALAFSYDATGLLTSVRASDGRTVSYSYIDGVMTSFTDPADAVTTYHADGHGRIASIIDADSRQLVSNTYDAFGRVAAQTVAGGPTATFTYDDANGDTTVTASTGGSVLYTHDAYGRLSSLQDPYGKAVARGYDSKGDITTATPRGGATFSQVFDTAGDLLSRTVGTTTVRYTYDSQGRVTSVTDPVGGVTKYTYDGDLRDPSTVTDAQGAVTQYSYDSDGRLLSRTDADGDGTSYTYNAAGQQTSVTDGAGDTTTMTYDAAGNLLSSTSPLGETTRYTYDADGRLLSTTDPTGAATHNDYSPGGLLLATTDPSGGKTAYTYNAAGQQTSVTTPTGAVTRYDYDIAGDMVSQTDPNGSVTTDTYDELGRRLSSTSPDGHITTYSYNANGTSLGSAGSPSSTSQTLNSQGQITSSTDALGNVTTRSYDSLGRLVSITDPTGAITSFTYDAVGHRLTTTDPLGAVTTNTYTPGGRLASTTGPLGRTTRYSYDNAGRLVAVTGPDGGVTRTSYDADGDVTATTTPGGLVTHTAYDADQRPVAVTGPDGGLTTTTYALTGQPLTVTDPTGATTRYAYDPAAELTAVTDPNGGVTRYAYDAAGDVVAVTDPNGHTTSYRYDSSRRVIAVTDPLGRTTTVGYDSSGNLTSIALPSGRMETMSYDADGRLLSRTAADGSTVAYAYDADGRLTQMDDSTGTTTYRYDADGRLLGTTAPDGGIQTNTYDAAGELTALIYPDGRQVGYRYGDTGQISRVNDPSAGATTYAYNSDGQLTGETLPGGTRAYSYTAGQLTGYTQEISGATERTSLNRDADGRITSETRNGKTYTYGYDAGGELVGITGQPGGPVSIAYDANGNRTSYTRGGVTTSYRYDSADELLSATASNHATTTYTYDADGRQTSAAGKHTGSSTTYDAWGLPTTQTDTQPSGSQTYTYTYDGQGNIVAISASSGKGHSGKTETTQLRWSTPAGGIPQLIEATGPGQQSTDFVYGHNRISADTGSDAALFAYAANGSTLATNDTRDWAIADGYDAFGVPNTGLHNNSPSIGFGYNGELTIGTLQDLRARQYDPVSGRLLTPDTLVGAPGAVSAENPYAYARNDPRDLADPSGESPAPDPTINALMPGLDQPLPDSVPTGPQRVTGNAYADAFFAMSMGVFNELHATAVALTAVSARERFPDALITTDMGGYFNELGSTIGGRSRLLGVLTLKGGYRPDVRVDEGLDSLIYEVKYNGVSAYTVAIPQIARYVALLTAADRLAAPGPALPPSGPVETPSGMFSLSVYPTPIPGLQVYDVEGGYPRINQEIVYRLNLLGISEKAQADGELEELPDGDVIVHGRGTLNMTMIEDWVYYQYKLCVEVGGEVVPGSCVAL